MTSYKKTILLVDNSSVIIDRLIIFIKNLPNIGTILSAVNYDDATYILSSVKIDIAIIDIHLDRKSGMDLLPIIKKLYPEIVTIIITNSPNEQYQILSGKLGARYFLDKSNDFPKIPAILSSMH